MNGATCIDGINSYTCVCPHGYTGNSCQTRINQCDLEPCRFGGTCVDHGDFYTCHCPQGRTGKNCDLTVDWCNENPCENNGECHQIGTRFECSCPAGWTGKLCDVRQVSCQVAANFRGVTSDKICENEGHCRDIGNSHECICADGYFGSYCQNEVNECLSQPCQNGATCRDLIGTYQCVCPPGFQGKNCEFNIDDCDPNPCQNNGLCHDLVNDFRCSCPHGTEGQLCEVNINECYPGVCHHGGECIDKIGTYECRCRPGFVGQRCEGDVNECLSNPCRGLGTKECIQLNNNYQCNCKPGWQGRHCETKSNFCQHNPCLNGGICSNHAEGHQCFCQAGFYGSNCQFSGQSCDSSPCQYGGTCLDNGTGYQCVCPPGTTGRQCEQDTRNECTYNPCKHGRCIDKIGDYDCSCTTSWRGKNCDIHDKASLGGVDNTDVHYSYDPYIERQKCIQNGCDGKRGDNICHEECNNHFCDYDGGDCRIGVNPWKLCNATSKGRNCWDVFQDGVCDESCNSKECLFDGRDCEGSASMECNAHFDVFCSQNFANGHCDERCNNAPCGWDGLDCESPSRRNQIIPGSFYVVLSMQLKDFTPEIQKRFERYLSLHGGTNFNIKRDETGEPMVHPFDPASIDTDQYAFNTNIMIHGYFGIVVYLEIDNVKCLEETGDNCFQDAEGYANLFSAMIGAEKLSDDWGIVQVGAGSDGRSNQGSSMTGVVIGVTILALIVVVIGVLMKTKKRKAKGVTWFPEGFLMSNAAMRQPKDATGQDMFGMPAPQKFPGSSLNMDYPHDGWSDDDPSEQQQPSKKQRRGEEFSSGQTIMTEYEDNDSRQWTQRHLNAADIRNPDIVGALTPPQGEMRSEIPNDVDVRGPMGMTPLMIASFRGDGVDTGDFENMENDDDDQSPAAIQDLISQGADLSSQMDKTGETPLHFAARYARADHAKKLLDNGSDANLQDNTGRTPLHAAVAADAQGVFHLLLKNRATNLNAKAFDGTTPLILAARLAIEGMVEELISADADINLADDNGKTALHWAASVNNVEAVNVLLANGANRDAQDLKDETPLFLAAKEGSYQAARALLDHCANRDIQDHMDRLPMHIAQEKMHQDIVTLLDEHVPPAPQMASSLHHQLSQHHHHQQQQQQLLGSPPHNGFPVGSSGTLLGSGAKARQPKKPRQSKQSVSSPEQQQQEQLQQQHGTLPKRKPSTKRKKHDSTSMDMMSPESSPYDGQSHFNGGNTGGGHHLAMSHPNLEEIMGSGNGKAPPSYEAAVVNNAMARSMHALQGGMPGQQNLEGQYQGFGSSQQQLQQQQQQQQQIHPRQQSMPASTSYNLSPPHSNMSPVQSPPHNAMSPPSSNMIMSPPQSIQSNHSAMSSPPQNNVPITTEAMISYR